MTLQTIAQSIAQSIGFSLSQLTLTVKLPHIENAVYFYCKLYCQKHFLQPKFDFEICYIFYLPGTSKNNNLFRSSCRIYSRRFNKIIIGPPNVQKFDEKPHSEFPSTGIGLKSSACNKLLKSINLSSFEKFHVSNSLIFDTMILITDVDDKSMIEWILATIFCGGKIRRQHPNMSPKILSSMSSTLESPKSLQRY